MKHKNIFFFTFILPLASAAMEKKPHSVPDFAAMNDTRMGLREYGSTADISAIQAELPKPLTASDPASGSDSSVESIGTFKKKIYSEAQKTGTDTIMPRDSIEEFTQRLGVIPDSSKVPSAACSKICEDVVFLPQAESGLHEVTVFDVRFQISESDRVLRIINKIQADHEPVDFIQHHAPKIRSACIAKMLRQDLSTAFSCRHTVSKQSLDLLDKLLSYHQKDPLKLTLDNVREVAQEKYPGYSSQIFHEYILPIKMVLKEARLIK